MLYTSSYPDTIQSHPLIAYSATSVFDVLFRTSFHFWNHNFWFPPFPISLHFSHWPLENASPLIFCHSHPPLRLTKPGRNFLLPSPPPLLIRSKRSTLHNHVPLQPVFFFNLCTAHATLSLWQRSPKIAVEVSTESISRLPQQTNKWNNYHLIERTHILLKHSCFVIFETRFVQIRFVLPLSVAHQMKYIDWQLIKSTFVFSNQCETKKSKLCGIRAKYFIVLSFGGNASGISLHNRKIKHITF